MTRPFFYLATRSFKNRLLSQIRRLKRPKYLLFALIGGTYFYFVAGRHWINGMRFAGQASRNAPPEALMEIGAALFVLGALVVSLCAPSPASPLTFSEAEIHYLFPAPLTRRSLVKWKLMRGQVGVIVSVLIFTAVSGPYLAGGGRLRFLAGAWVAFATMQFCLTGIRMSRHRLALSGIGWASRTAAALGLTVAGLIASAWWSWRSVGPPDPALIRHMQGPGGVIDYVSRLFATGPAWALTLPARWLVRPALAHGAVPFLLALPWALGLLAAAYSWVVRSGVILEEGALAAARRMEEARQSFGQGRRGRARRVRATAIPFRLAPVGRPEVALMWKNMVCVLRNAGGVAAIFWLLAAWSVPALVVTILRFKGMETAAQIQGMLCAMTAAILLVAGPSMIRSDFRRDLLMMDLLKSYPIRGHTILLGTLLTPVLLLTAIQWGLLTGFALLSGASTSDLAILKLGPPALALTAALLALPMNVVAALIHNAALLMVPGWVTLGPTRTTGVERMGQGMVTTLGFLLAMAVVFIPAAVIFGITWFFASSFLGAAAAMPVSAIPSIVVLLAEAWIGVALLGAYLDRFDPSKELDALTKS